MTKERAAQVAEKEALQHEEMVTISSVSRQRVLSLCAWIVLVLRSRPLHFEHRRVRAFGVLRRRVLCSQRLLISQYQPAAGRRNEAVWAGTALSVPAVWDLSKLKLQYGLYPRPLVPQRQIVENVVAVIKTSIWITPEIITNFTSRVMLAIRQVLLVTVMFYTKCSSHKLPLRLFHTVTPRPSRCAQWASSAHTQSAGLLCLPSIRSFL